MHNVLNFITFLNFLTKIFKYSYPLVLKIQKVCDSTLMKLKIIPVLTKICMRVGYLPSPKRFWVSDRLWLSSPKFLFTLSLWVHTVIDYCLYWPRNPEVKTLVAKSRGRGFESHREQKVNFSNFIYFQKLK